MAKDIINYENEIEDLENELKDPDLTESRKNEIDTQLEKLYIIEDFMLKNRNYYDIEALQAYLDLGHDITEIENGDFEEAYQGRYSSDEDFVEELLIETGDLPENLPSYIHIDWEATARDIMMDYEEENGYYFRSY